MKYSKELFNKIKITTDMLDYNVGNILRGDFKVTNDPYIRKNRKNLCYDKRYENTILGIYFRNVLIKKKLYSAGYSGLILKLSIDKYIKQNIKNLKLPSQDELVLYFRLGDHLPHINKIGGKLFYNYKEQINNKLKYNKYKKITIVTNLAFCGVEKHSDIIDENIKDGVFYKSFQSKNTCEYSKKNINLNREKFLPVLDDIINSFPEFEIDIFSNYNPDYDICYLYKNGFIGDRKSTWYKMFNYNRK